MPGAARQAATRIARLRAAASGIDPLAARLRLERLLGAADFQPPGLGPDAVLVVRHLRDPCPGALSLSGADPRPPARWGAALSGRLSELARRAARPVDGAVPAAAEAVLFASRDELLLCVAREHLRGGHAGWWWEVLFPERDLAAAFLAELHAAPERLPALLAALARAGEAGRLVRQLGATHARTLLRALAERLGLAALARVLRRLDAPAAPRESGAGPSPGALPACAAPGTPEPLGAGADPHALSWRDRVPEAAEIEEPSGALLLGLGLLLARAPARARTEAFARSVAAWLDAAPATSAASSSDAARALENRPRERSTSPATPPLASAAPTRAAEWSPDRSATRPAPPSHLAPEPPRELPEAGRSEAHDPATLARAGPDAGAATLADTHRLPAPLASPAPSARLAAPTPTPTPGAGAGAVAPDAVATPTQLGGLFFLLNLALELELYGDFTRPLAAGLALSPWDLLELLGRRLLGDAAPDDPVWRLLAGLAGRSDGEAAGCGFAAPRRWRVPRTWLRPFTDSRARFGAPVPPAALRRGRSEGGRRLEHPAGFAVVDRPARSDPAGPGEALERWTGWLARYVHARLALALRVDDPAAAPLLLLCHRARVVAAPTRVEVHFAQDMHPIAIRVAGLDRDPGWIPAAGRAVAFHFE